MSLIEIFIYFSLILILTLFLFGYTLHVTKYSKNLDLINENLIRNSLVIDILRRDISGASDTYLEWDLNNFVFRKNYLSKDLKIESVDIGWIFSQEGVYRLEGVYNYLTCKWVKNVSSKVCKKNFLENLKLSFIKIKNNIVGIKIELNKNNLIFNIKKGELT